MTIASEITRLQNDKAAICTAIENKGVTVGAVTLDSYAACIDAIEQGGGGNTMYVDVALVGGGGGGGHGYCGYCGGGGGGGGGEVLGVYKMPINNITPVFVGEGGAGNSGCSNFPQRIFNQSCNGGDSAFGAIVAGGGGAGGVGYGCGVSIMGGVAKGGGGGAGLYRGYYNVCGGVSKNTGWGNNASCCGDYGGLGGGAWTDGLRGSHGKSCEIFGDETYFGGGGGGGSQFCNSGSSGVDGGGVGGGKSSSAGGNATNYGGGGGGNGCYGKPGNGCRGLVVVRYPADGSYGITNAIGGTKSLKCGYCYHCFTQGGGFVAEPDDNKKYITYLAVGGGGGGANTGGGGGGAVCYGGIEYNSPISIKIGNGGNLNADGGDTCFGDIVAHGGKGGNGCIGGASGSGVPGGTGCSGCGGGGGGASFPGWSGCPQNYTGYLCCYLCSLRGRGGLGLLGYGGGGGAGGRNDTTNYGGAGECGAGNGGCDCGCSAKTYGSGGGGYRTCCAGKGIGCQGVVDVCYACDGSWGVHSATGGNCCYTCNGMCVHRFTSNGTFTIVS